MQKLRGRIRNAEADGVSDTIVRLFRADAGAQKDTFLTATMARLETLSQQITTATMQDKAVSTLRAADGARDEAIRTLGTILAAYAVFPIAEKQAHAVPLKAVYDKYAKAGITAANYTSESSLTESLLEDFAADGLADNIAALEGVAESLAQVRERQDAFTAARDAYMQAAANKGATASSFNKPIVSLINDKLIPYLDAMVIAEDADCAAFARNVAAEIGRMNETVAKRIKRRAGAAANGGEAVSP